MRAAKKWTFRLVLVLLAPLLVLLVEWGLRRQEGTAAPLVQVQREDGIWWATNPEYGRAVFPREAGPMLPSLWLPAAKAERELRIVVLGESAAEGFPIPAFGLARVLETLLVHRAPEVHIRVVSLAMSGINSHQIGRLGLAAARHLEPDIVVLYAGNNEVIGPNGPAGVLSGFHRSLLLARLQGALREWRLARRLDFAVRRWQPAPAAPRVWRGLDEFERNHIAFDDPRLAVMYRHFEANLNSLVRGLTRRGIRVAICTMGVNLNDWPPLGSEPEAAPEAATEPWPPDAVRSAKAAYRQAVDLAGEGAVEAAWTWYRRACDLDLVRFRADSRINNLLRGVAAVNPGRTVLVDVDRALHETDLGGGDDRRWFYEHVHLTLAGQIAVAERIADELAAAGWIPAPRGGEDEAAALARLLVFTPKDEILALTAIREFYRWPLFAGQPHSDRRIAALEAELQRLKSEWLEWDADRIRQLWEEARALLPRDSLRDMTVGLHLLSLGDAAAARVAVDAASEADPTLVQARAEAARTYLRLGDLDRAWGHIVVGLAQNSGEPALLAVRGEWAVFARRWDEAEEYLSEAHRLRPRDLRIVIQLARTAEARGDLARAEAFCRTGLEISPGSPHFLNNLALLLSSRAGTLDEALALATRATEAAPSSPAVWRTLEHVLKRRGDAMAPVRPLVKRSGWSQGALRPARLPAMPAAREPSGRGNAFSTSWMNPASIFHAVENGFPRRGKCGRFFPCHCESSNPGERPWQPFAVFWRFVRCWAWAPACARKWRWWGWLPPGGSNGRRRG